MSRFAFASAPDWYRLLLRAETRALQVAYPRQRRAAEARDVPAAAEHSHARPNVLGNLIPERAVPGAVTGWVMGQHVARYAWAMTACSDQRVVELGSGAGYGAHLLSWVARDVVGLDVDAHAVEAAAGRYPGVRYEVKDLVEDDELPAADVAVCFEVLEHLTDPIGFLNRALRAYPRMLLSFPNPIFHGSHLNPHHRVDWPLRRLKNVVKRAGGDVTAVLHQQRRAAAVMPGAFPWSSIWLLDIWSGPPEGPSSPAQAGRLGGTPTS